LQKVTRSLPQGSANYLVAGSAKNEY
jgi:hypothetical protein